MQKTKEYPNNVYGFEDVYYLGDITVGRRMFCDVALSFTQRTQAEAIAHTSIGYSLATAEDVAVLSRTVAKIRKVLHDMLIMTVDNCTIEYSGPCKVLEDGQRIRLCKGDYYKLDAKGREPIDNVWSALKDEERCWEGHGTGPIVLSMNNDAHNLLTVFPTRPEKTGYPIWIKKVQQQD